jgi:hypothetical protein
VKARGWEPLSERFRDGIERRPAGSESFRGDTRFRGDGIRFRRAIVRFRTVSIRFRRGDTASRARGARFVGYRDGTPGESSTGARGTGTRGGACTAGGAACTAACAKGCGGNAGGSSSLARAESVAEGTLTFMGARAGNRSFDCVLGLRVRQRPKRGEPLAVVKNHVPHDVEKPPIERLFGWERRGLLWDDGSRLELVQKSSIQEPFGKLN